jgi:drug/metabolite transporter (DMT)-like permease
MTPGQWLLLLANASSFASSILINKILVGQLPLLSVLFGALFLGERLGANAFVGMALILGGSLIVDGAGLGRARATTGPGRRPAAPASGGAAAAH